MESNDGLGSVMLGQLGGTGVAKKSNSRTATGENLRPSAFQVAAF